MGREFELPDVGEGVAEGELVSWLVAEGDSVREEQPIAEVETDKALVEVPSPVDGTVSKLCADEGEVVPVGDVIVVFAVDGDAREEADSQTEREPEPDEDGTDARAPDEAETPDGRVFAPPSVRRLARELGVDIDDVSAAVSSGRVTETDVRAYASEDGTAEERAAVTDTGTAGQTEAAQRVAATSASGSAERPAAAGRETTLATPATRRVAAAAGVDIDDVPASENRDGHGVVTTEDVREYADSQRTVRTTDCETPTADTGPAGVGEDRPETREPYRGVRRTIGEAMVDSKATAPHVTHHDEIDVTELVETRAELEAHVDDRDGALTYMPFVMKACVAALEEYPIVNASLDEESDEIVTKHYYDIGVATATDAGLMVPVVEGVDRKGLLELAAEVSDLAERARERTIDPAELQGSTFTISNVGGIGGEYATPIINQPEVAILALGEITKKPRVVTDENGEDAIESRHVLPVSLSFDHRLIDGADGARFVNEVTEYLETPTLLLVE
ncbi:dihydrolipoamide acetyltransferase family protein [Halopiger djelfimassiliensis]|uniref:dihydrolipoamide acetyltransferase family protein n=1 Tax=Halopiger djelfimassiliensis TaxID=1293047 RepID=UPI0006783173|nr:dihydrolipoamide acetyltransferase family protein [Halopiger djelfimassiliensis]